MGGSKSFARTSTACKLHGQAVTLEVRPVYRVSVTLVFASDHSVGFHSLNSVLIDKRESYGKLYYAQSKLAYEIASRSMIRREW